MSGTRKNVTTACNLCKHRRKRCSGERPECTDCQRSGRTCVYTQADGRIQRRSVREELSDLREYHERAQGSSGQQDTTSTDPLPFEPRPVGLPPFGTGEMVLDLDGRLQPTSDSTFYRSTRRISPERKGFLESDGMTQTTPSIEILPEDTYHLESHSLIGLAFSNTVSFGMVNFMQDFWEDRLVDRTSRTPYHSRLLYLVLLAIGWRHQTDSMVVQRYYDRFEDRGLDMIRLARGLVDKETEDPKLSTLLALYLLCGCLVGLGQDRIASVYYCKKIRHRLANTEGSLQRGLSGSFIAIGIFLAQDCKHTIDFVYNWLDADWYRLHSQSTSAMRRTICEARHGSAWWSSYFARASLTNWQARTQRLPVSALSSTANIYPYHMELARIALKILDCNHSVLIGDAERMTRAQKVHNEMEAWSLSLPLSLRWPAVCDTEHALPSTVATLALFEAYHILLCRPYLSRNQVDVLDCLSVCSLAASTIVSQTRYLAGRFNISTFPLTIQHILFVAGTVYVIRLSGISPLVPTDVQQLRQDLGYTFSVLEAMSVIWPAARSSLLSLQQLAQEYCL